jgi:hypothetical protein
MIKRSCTIYYCVNPNNDNMDVINSYFELRTNCLALPLG